MPIRRSGRTDISSLKDFHSFRTLDSRGVQNLPNLMQETLRVGPSDNLVRKWNTLRSRMASSRCNEGRHIVVNQPVSRGVFPNQACSRSNYGNIMCSNLSKRLYRAIACLSRVYPVTFLTGCSSQLNGFRE